MTIKEFLLKSVSFFPLRLKHLTYDKIRKNYLINKDINEIASLLSIMKGSNKNYDYVIRKNLTSCLRSAYKEIPYWHYFEQLKHTNKRNCYEILETLPLLTKDIIRLQGINMNKPGRNFDNSYSGSTGGTTGQPLYFLRSTNKEETHQKALYQFMSNLPYENNLDYDGRIISFDGTRPTENDITNKVFWTKEVNSKLYGSFHFCSFYMIEDNMPYYVEKLNELKPFIIRGYSNAILTLAEYVSKHDSLCFNPIAIYVTSEYCSKQSMNFISKTLKCNVYGQYGQTEACLFAWTNANEDTYFCSPHYGYVEILNDNNTHVKPGEIGEVVVTAFYKDNVQPFIRYKTGDLVKYGGTINGVVQLAELKGRTGEFIYGKNNEIIRLVGFIDIHYLSCKDKILSYQIEQNEIGKIIFKVIKTDDWNIKDETEIKTLLSKRGIEVTFNYPKSIPLTIKGKQKVLIQNIGK